MAALSLAVFASRSCLDNPFMHFLCQLRGLRARIVILIALWHLFASRLLQAARHLSIVCWLSPCYCIDTSSAVQRRERAPKEKQ